MNIEVKFRGCARPLVGQVMSPSLPSSIPISGSHGGGGLSMLPAGYRFPSEPVSLSAHLRRLPFSLPFTTKKSAQPFSDCHLPSPSSASWKGCSAWHLRLESSPLRLMGPPDEAVTNTKGSRKPLESSPSTLLPL